MFALELPGLLAPLILAFYLIQPVVAQAITFQPLGVPFKAPATVAPGLAASVIFSNLTTPRGIAFDAQHNLLVVERGFGVTAFRRTSTPAPGWERTVVIANIGFTQGIQVDGGELYVSTASDAFVYHYDATTRSIVAGSVPYSIVSGIPADGELTTHTLQLEKDLHGHSIALLVANGPLTNVDPTARDPASGRSQVRRFLLPSSPSSTPLQWANGQIIAFGIRNPAGFAFPPDAHPSSVENPATKSLLVVENGASIDGLADFTTAFVNDNPADELELVSYPTDPASTSPLLEFYGFPDCTTLWNGNVDPVGDARFVGLPRGTQFSLQLEPSRDDAWCQAETNNVPPVLSFQAHSVPLDIKFYKKPITGAAKGLPSSLHGHAFVSFHGSFNRAPPTGYGVVQFPYPIVPLSPSNPLGYTFVIQATNLASCPGSCIRPVGLAFGSHDGRLYVSSDSSGELFVVEKA